MVIVWGNQMGVVVVTSPRDGFAVTKVAVRSHCQCVQSVIPTVTASSNR